MVVREGYKLTEVGVVPEDWKVVELNELGAFYKGRGIRKTEVTDSGFDCIRYGQLYTQYSEVTEHTVSKINSRTATNSFELKKGDVLFAGSGEKKEEIGKSTVFVGEQQTYAGGDIVVLRPNDSAGAFYGYALNSEVAQKQKAMAAQGDAVVHIYSSSLKNLQIPLPPTKAEQRAIATALGDADAWIRSLEALLAKKRRVKEGVMGELLRPGVGWREVTYGEVFKFLKTSSYSRSQLSDRGDYGYIHYGDIHTKWDAHLSLSKELNTFIPLELRRHYSVVKRGDLIMADASEDVNAIGLSTEVTDTIEGIDTIAGLHTILMRDELGIFVNGFRGLIHQIVSVKEQLDRVANGLKVYGVSKGALVNVIIPLPPKEEQIKIVSTLQPIETELQALQAKLTKARALKSAMMQELLTGKIRLV